jgi:hypothetical protein
MGTGDALRVPPSVRIAPTSFSTRVGDSDSVSGLRVDSEQLD